jgi:hypothetical protein
MERLMPLLKLREKGFLVPLIFIISLCIMSTSLFATSPRPSFAPQMSVFSRDGSQLIFVNAGGNEIIKQQTVT